MKIETNPGSSSAAWRSVGVSMPAREKRRIPQFMMEVRLLSILPNFPNSFLMLGPNTPIGNYSVIAMSEVQCAYILKIICRWQQGDFDEIDVKPSAFKSFNEYLKAGMSKTVWVGGCQSWYLDDDGDPALWPYSWQQWKKEMKEPKMGDFITKKFPIKTENTNKKKKVAAVA